MSSSPVFWDWQTLGAWIKRELTLSADNLISIDGFTGSGKSSLAISLSETLAIAVVHLDDFIEGEIVGDYLGALRLTNIEQAITVRGTVIVEGVSIGDCLERLSCRPTLTVYVKRLSDGVKWSDEDELLACPPLDRVAPPNELRKSVRKYHHDRRPHETSDAIFVWIEQ